MKQSIYLTDIFQNRNRSHRYSVDYAMSVPKNSVSYQPKYRHIMENKKRDQLLEGNYQIERFTEIERENRILLEKIHKIMQTDNQTYTHRVTKSLNFSQRVKNQRKISKENLDLLKKLKSKKSLYDFNIHQGKLEKNNSIASNLFQSGLSRFPSNDKPFHINTHVKLTPISFDFMHSVFTKSIFIQNRVFLIEITRGNNKIRVIATEESTGDRHTLELSRNEGLTLMGGIEDWGKLMKCIHIEHDNLELWQEDINSSLP